MDIRLKVMSQEAVKNKATRIAEELKDGLDEEGVRYKLIESTDEGNISVIVRGENRVDRALSFIEDEYPDLVEVSREVTDGVMSLEIGFSEEYANEVRTMAVEDAVETIRTRINMYGVSESVVQKHGEEDIIVNLPGVKDIERARDLVKRSAMLEFKLVDTIIKNKENIPTSLPAGQEVLEGVDGYYYVIYKKTLLTGEYLTEATVDIGQRGDISIGFVLNKKGGERFEKITGDHINEPLAIILDGKVESAPNISTRIGSRGTITGNYTLDEAKDLALVLRAGSLRAPLKMEYYTDIGPSLGKDSINSGLLSICIGGILVVVFMAIYYKLSGVMADFALVVNILLIAAGLAVFKATLTLPGIAGIILTIGMAVDANVLIFERIREELRIGKTPRAAMEAGYDRATLTILDANITTLIAALVLFKFGTGPVKGFAVTLSLGVISSLFTSLLLTRSLFDLYLSSRKVKQLSI
jgi:preprotein translocase subunit SecD